MISYEINRNTLAIIPINDTQTKVVEKDNIFIVESSSIDIIRNSCEFFGSSYLGRKEGTKKLTGITHKSPIIIEDSNDIIFFPTCSPRIKECGWISLNNVENYKAFNKNSLIIFNNNLKLEIPVSNKIINNQMLKATRLESVMNKRRKKIQN
jgi:competence protein ComK